MDPPRLATPRAYFRAPAPQDVDADARQASVQTRSYITISRQVGAGGCSLPHLLTQALQARSRPSSISWTMWDRELIRKAACDHHLPIASIEKLERSGYSWLDSFLSGLNGMPDEMTILHGMTRSLRALASAGHVVLVGHGSAFMTHDLPGGVRLRLVAPLGARIDHVAQRMRLTRPDAARVLTQAQRARTRFLRRYWPGQSVAPEVFTATLNTAELSEEQMVNCVVAMVKEGP